jgi:hypothetical protein
MFKFLITTLFIIHYSLFIPPALAAVSPDAIGVRIVSNTDHYSPARWYQKNIKVQSAPQSMMVDGYEAVRDGRTVYAAVANVTGNKLYTNIYLISYNNNSEPETIDIFGQMLNHWRFNTNIAGVGQCSKFGANPQLGKNCYVDQDCAQGEFCTSLKANITRDTRRLADIKELDLALADYHTGMGFYPKLAAGTYVPNYTLSVWPSWNDNLSKALGIALPVDPINKLGDCGGDNYNVATCWDEKVKKFCSVLPALPLNSSVYTYSVAQNGSSYTVRPNMESGLNY